ncbi:hypothetical protein JW935_09505 [candidate division KSB1 bacterium]|nr:hypothetical protein [candidate division KSB1 bacterium]
MSNGAVAGGAAAAAAIANAIKAAGSIIRVEPRDFEIILSKQKSPLIVFTTGGVFTTNFQYLTNYKGLTFFTKSSQQLNLPGDAEVVAAKTIWIPN